MNSEQVQEKKVELKADSEVNENEKEKEEMSEVNEKIETVEQKLEKQQESSVPFEEAKVVEEVEPEEQRFIEDNLELSHEYKLKGNEYFKSVKLVEAIEQYQNALQYTANPKLKATLYSNIAISFIKLEDYRTSIKYCKKSLAEDNQHTKSRLNLARCYEQEQKFDEALDEYKKLNATSNPDKFVSGKVAELQKKVDEINQKKKEEVISGLKTIGNSILGYFGMSLDNFKFEQGPNGGYNISLQQ